MINPHNFPIGIWVEHRDNGSEGMVVEHTNTKCVVEFTDGLLRGRTVAVLPFSLDRVRGQRYVHDASAASPKAEPQTRKVFTPRQYELKGAAISHLAALRERPVDEKGKLCNNVVRRNTGTRLSTADDTEVMFLRAMLVMCEVTQRTGAHLAQPRERWVWFNRVRVTPEVPGSIFRDGIASLYRKAS